MSTLVFNGAERTLTHFDSSGQQVGRWYANNVVDRRATMRFVPNNTFNIIDQTHPHRHGSAVDTRNGAYGQFGIIRMQSFSADGHAHDGVGIHAGRANQGGEDHATMGCIRTSEAAMESIARHMRIDPLRSIAVHHNHVQNNRHPHHAADHHNTRANPATNEHNAHPHPPNEHQRPSTQEIMSIQVGHGPKQVSALKQSDYVIKPHKK
jgi:hypothetical protein